MEQNKQEYWFNSRLYTSKNQRVACFGRETENGKLEIFELKCSSKDEFSKSYAQNIYKRHLNDLAYGGCHPIIHYKEPLKGDSIKFTFELYCKENFYHRFEQTRKYKEIILMKLTGNEKPIVLSAKRSYKMDKTY